MPLGFIEFGKRFQSIKTKPDKMHRLVCGEIWGGYRNCNEDENEIFGLNRLKAFLNKNADRSPLELKEMIMNEVSRYAGGRLNHDDVTIMIAEIGKIN